MWKIVRPTLSLMILFTALLGLLYPLVITGFGQAVFPFEANGSMLVARGRSVGSALVGQPFSHLGHFWSRPSATTPQPYNARASAGSNLGPSNLALHQAVVARKAALHAADPQNRQAIPIDLVTASASGLDPHISAAAAEFQVARVARACGLPQADVRRLVAEHLEGRFAGLLGETRVNVLRLNLALEMLQRPGAK